MFADQGLADLGIGDIGSRGGPDEASALEEIRGRSMSRGLRGLVRQALAFVETLEPSLMRDMRGSAVQFMLCFRSK